MNHWPQLFIFPTPLSLYSLIIGQNVHFCSLTSGLSIWFLLIAYQLQTKDLKDYPYSCLLSCTSGMSLQGTCVIQLFGSKMRNIYSRSIPVKLGTCRATQAPRAWNQATYLSLVWVSWTPDHSQVKINVKCCELQSLGIIHCTSSLSQ